MTRKYNDVSQYHDEIVTLSKDHILADISRVIGIHRTSIKDYMKRNNITCFVKKGFVNETRFKTLDDEPAAYYYGFLVTDGCLGKNKNHVTLSLSHEDTHILETMKWWMESYAEINTDICNRKSGHITIMKRFTFANKIVRLSLESHGLHPQKSKIATVPNTYSHDNSWSKHFWRGVIDGDGSLYINTNKCRVINLVGSLDLCEKFRDYCNSKISISMVPSITKTDNIFSVSFAGRNAIEIAKHLYLDSDPKYRLVRKYNTMLSFIESEKDKNKTREGLPSEVRAVETVLLKGGNRKFRPYVTTYKRVHLGSFDTLDEALSQQQEFKQLYEYLLNS